MNEQEILNLIKQLQQRQTETVSLEAKAARVDFPKKCYDTFSSFANTKGGVILFGIDEEKNFEVCGVYDTNDLQKKIVSMCKDVLEPKLKPEFLVITVEEGKNVLACKIDELLQKDKPCYYKNAGINNGSYIRIGDSDEVMTQNELYSIIAFKKHIKDDLRIVEDATIEDLDKNKIKKYIEVAKKIKSNFEGFDDIKILKLCGVLKEQTGKIYPTVAGVLLFAEYPQFFFPQLFIACTAFPGLEVTDVGTEEERFVDNLRVEGTLAEMLEKALAFVTRNTKTKVIIDERGKRTDKPEYPEKALREAIANALVHRDYSENRTSSYIQLRIFKDRLEIQNPGGLYGTTRLDKLDSSEIMEVRNEIIMRILEESTDIIENRHTGIPTMKLWCDKYGLKEPEFKVYRESFAVIFYTNQSNIEYVTTQDTAQDTTQDEISEDKLLLYISNPKSIKEIMKHFGYSNVNHFREKYMKPLLIEGKIKLTLPEKPTSKNQKYYSDR